MTDTVIPEAVLAAREAMLKAYSRCQDDYEVAAAALEAALPALRAQLAEEVATAIDEHRADQWRLRPDDTMAIALEDAVRIVREFGTLAE